MSAGDLVSGEIKPEPSLLPCPHCGGAVAFEPYKNNGLKIACKPCHTSYQQRVLHCSLNWLQGYMTEQWNHRAALAKAGANN